VLENRVPRKLLGTKTDKVAGGWIKLYYEELNDFCFSPIFSGDLNNEYDTGGTCSTHGEKRNECKYFGEGGNLKDRDHLEDPAEDDRIILKWALKIGGYVDWIHLVDYMGK
jgi:hypothetical protein